MICRASYVLWDDPESIRPRPLDQNKNFQDIAAILGIDEFNENDKLGDCVRKIERFFSRSFFVGERLTGVPGCCVRL